MGNLTKYHSATKNPKNCPQKLLIIGPELFFQYWPSCPNGQKQKSCTTKSHLMQDWVFKLGFLPNFVKRLSNKKDALGVPRFQYFVNAP